MPQLMETDLVSEMLCFYIIKTKIIGKSNKMKEVFSDLQVSTLFRFL